MTQQSKIFNYKQMAIIEELFDMKTGYVIDFSNNTFANFVYDSIGINIYSDKGYEEYTSKANKLRQIVSNEPFHLVSKLISDLMDYYEDYKLRKNKLTEYDKKKIKEIKDICSKSTDNSCRIQIPKELNEKIELISTRSASFEQMATDEKLKEIGNLIEYLLKDENGFSEIDYSFSANLINNDNVKEYRKKVQCFRHSSKESINERNSFNEEQKKFLIEYGILLAIYIYNQVTRN